MESKYTALNWFNKQYSGALKAERSAEERNDMTAVENIKKKQEYYLMAIDAIKNSHDTSEQSLEEFIRFYCQDKLNYIKENYGTDDLLVQLAEECAEASQSACKLHRAFNGLTPVSCEDANENLLEELADVLTASMVYLTLDEWDLIKHKMIEKINRWYERTWDYVREELPE